MFKFTSKGCQCLLRISCRKQAPHILPLQPGKDTGAVLSLERWGALL